MFIERILPLFLRDVCRWCFVPAFFAIHTITSSAPGQTVVTDRMHHLRADGGREWSEFPKQAEASQLDLEFDFEAEIDLSEEPCTIRVRQSDVKQKWQVTLNEKRIGNLTQDESDMMRFFEVPAGSLKKKGNTLSIKQVGGGNKGKVDDIRVGSIAVFARSPDELLSETTVKVRVTDQADDKIVPSRITVVDENNSLVQLLTESDGATAVRPGAVYSNGDVTVKLPVLNSYRFIIGRGFEWSIHDAVYARPSDGETLMIEAKLRRVVQTDGWVSADTHVHTLTHSGHGDCSMKERMITIAGEGIELPIATDHNKHIDYDPLATELGLRGYFTPVIGNEVTTKVGHFNVFPMREGEKPPRVDGKNWNEVFEAIKQSDSPRVFILNHARDVHSGYRPFDPLNHNAVAGENLDDWPFHANAMEILNSGATQTDVLELTRDWFGLLNSGKQVTPVGCSDSHDVSRYIIGQGRTYIRCDDSNPGEINVDEAIDSFLAGRVTVSYGLMTELTVNDGFGSGDVADKSERYDAKVVVRGPDWVKARHVGLYVNGNLYAETNIEESGKPAEGGIQFEWNVQLTDLPHDVFICAVATGDGIADPYWPTAKPYQPDSPDWTPKTMGVSGAVWIDADGDGKATSAREIAKQRLKDFDGKNVDSLLKSLANDHSSVAAQAAYLLSERGISPVDDRLDEPLSKAPENVVTGFRKFADTWKESQIARAKK